MKRFRKWLTQYDHENAYFLGVVGIVVVVFSLGHWLF